MAKQISSVWYTWKQPELQRTGVMEEQTPFWGAHTWHLLSKTIVCVGVPTMQLSCGKIGPVMEGCPGFSHNNGQYPHMTRFAIPLASAWIFSSSSVRQNHNLSAVWFEKQVANCCLQGSSMKLVSLDDAQRGKKLLNQWSERQRDLRLMISV